MSAYETIPQDEAARLEGYGAELARLQQRRAAKGGEVARRALHLKAHTGASGELVVTAPESARVGVFSELGKRYPVYVRFSNGGSRAQPDGAPDVRGLAVKLVGVPGKKIIPGLEHAPTQDFCSSTIRRFRSAIRTSSWPSCAPRKTARQR